MREIGVFMGAVVDQVLNVLDDIHDRVREPADVFDLAVAIFERGEALAAVP
jgi:hypothetical protein